MKEGCGTIVNVTLGMGDVNALCGKRLIPFSFRKVFCDKCEKLRNTRQGGKKK